jgi:hypothetical protein
MNIPAPRTIPAPRPMPPAEAIRAILGDIREDGRNISEARYDPWVVDSCLETYALRLEAVATQLGPSPEHSPSVVAPTGPGWRTVALMNPAGKLLWRYSPPGGWPSLGPIDARQWPDLDDFRAWLACQMDDVISHLARGGWRPVELITAARPLPSPLASPLVPAVAEAVADSPALPECEEADVA